MAHIKEIIGEEAFNALSEDKRKELGKKDFEDVSNGSFVSKKLLDDAKKEAKTYKDQVDERDNQIRKLQDNYPDVDGLTKELKDLELANKNQKETYENQLNEISFNNALEKGLSAFSVKDKTLIMALLNKENLKVDGDNIIGLKEQIEPLQKSHEYLFEKAINGTSSFNTGGGDDVKSSTKTNFATELGKQKATAMQNKGITDFAK